MTKAVPMQYDAVVVGLGAMGSASLYQLAKRGKRVLGIDLFAPPHNRGSSHGETRITRQAITEGAEYVPLILRSNEIWRELEQQTHTKFLHQTGIAILADVESQTFRSTIHSAEAYNIGHEILDTTATKQRFPQFKLQGVETAYFEPGGGYLLPELCIESQLNIARDLGAEIHTNEEFIKYTQTPDGIELETTSGTYQTKTVIFALGAQVKKVLPKQYLEYVRLYRQVLYWFELEPGQAQLFNPSVFAWEFGDRAEDFMYGFPALDGRTIKLATEQFTQEIEHPDELDRHVSKEEVDDFYVQYVKPRFNGISPICSRAVACLYTTLPKRRFLIDRLPENQNVIIVSPCSGHGFKYSAAIGEVVADMATGNQPQVDVSMFGFDNLT